MKLAEIRETFLQYFEAKEHTRVASSSLIPANDPTLLFTNAGMVQFKDVFTGLEKKSYLRATTAQRCLRAGGKHNDLENVGYTARHHTFFEMMGNFSFGDYFKKEAIIYGWELLTDVFKLPKGRLWVTVYHEDEEAYQIWKTEVGVPVERIIRIGDNKGQRYASDNFWAMGDTGPCGPCSEVFYDHGETIWGGPPGSAEEDGDRFIEIWNFVFMQYNRDAQGELHLLPKPCVDTGMGLERIAAVLQHVHSNYEIDLFQHLIAAAARETQQKTLEHNSLKVIADHIRACAFLMMDGVLPSNEGRGYVLRRIIRRAVRHGYKLGQKQAFFYRLIPDLVVEMGLANPELMKAQAQIAQTLAQEEKRFYETLEQGITILEAALAEKTVQNQKILKGETAFKLHDTFGFPLDLTADICREHGVSVDEAGFEIAMNKQKAQARASGKFKTTQQLAYDGEKSHFHGYESLSFDDAKVLALYVEGESVQQAQPGQVVTVILDQTPFYAESGGQVSDQGVLRNASVQIHIVDVQKVLNEGIAHFGQVEQGVLKVGDVLQALVNDVRRKRVARNHSATHLAHAALKALLGAHVQQKGSLVDEEKARFDFVHTAALTAEEIIAVERLVNAEIFENAPGVIDEMPFDEAVRAGAIALFGEKYGEKVRVLTLGSSKELCGGTHVQSTGEIGLFKVLSESGVAAGVRRIEFTTGDQALSYVQARDALLVEIANQLKVTPTNVPERLQQLQSQIKTQDKALQTLKAQFVQIKNQHLLEQVFQIDDVNVLIAQLDEIDIKQLRGIVDDFKSTLKKAVILFATVQGERIHVIAGVTDHLTGMVKAGDLVAFVAQKISGKGGGRADLAQAGGSDLVALPSALKEARVWIERKMRNNLS